MEPLCPRNNLQMTLTAIVYFMVALTTCSTKECRLQLTEKTKSRSVILRNIDTRMCLVDCVKDAFIVASCLQLREPRKKVVPSRSNDQSHHHVHESSWVSKVCNTTSVCLEKGCSKVCVQAPSFCDLHSASKTLDMTKVKVILSQGRTGINCKEWNRTPVVLPAREGQKNVVHLLVSNGADVSVVDDFGIHILHFVCQGGVTALVKYVNSLGAHGINGKVFCGGTPVMLSAENGHREVVELLVDRGANASPQDNNGNNILHFACREGDEEVVKYILSQNMVDINSRGWKGMTPVLIAAEQGYRDVVELLFRKGANMSLKDENENNILYFACREGHVEVVKYILSQNMVDINSRGLKRITPVLIAAERGHRDIVELLFRKGAKMSLKDENENNILYFACREGHVEVVKYILSQNMVDINNRGLKRITPVLIAAERGHRDIVELLFRKGAKMSLKDENENNILYFACREGHVEVVKYILSQNMVDINSRGPKRITPVLIAAERGHRDIVELLFRKGAKMSLKDENENNILYFACREGHVEVVKYILSQNMVDINSRGPKRITPVLIAAERGHRDIVELLFRKGAKMSLKDENENNILYFACREGHVEVVKYILSQNMVDINSRGPKRITPVLIAAERGHRDIVELLFRKGAKMSLKDENENNILHFACRGGHVEVVKYILSQNMVDINSRGSKRMTPVLIAAESGHGDIVELLFRKGAKMSLKDENENNILYFACREGHVEVVKYILSQNMVDINSRGPKRITPVLIAAERGHMDIVELLFRKGANMSLKDEKENNVLHYACRRGHMEVVKYVLSKNMVDINNRNSKHETPVIIAAERGHEDVEELLVSEGADLSQDNT